MGWVLAFLLSFIGFPGCLGVTCRHVEAVLREPPALTYPFKGGTMRIYYNSRLGVVYDKHGHVVGVYALTRTPG